MRKIVLLFILFWMKSFQVPASVEKFIWAFAVLCNEQRINLALWKMKFSFLRWPLVVESTGGRKEQGDEADHLFAGKGWNPAHCQRRGIVWEPSSV